MGKSFIERRYTVHKGTHQRIIVKDTKGLVWEITYAEPWPTDAVVLDLFKHEKRRFEPHYYMR